LREVWDSLSFPRLGNARHDKARLRAAWHGNEIRIAWQIGERAGGSGDPPAVPLLIETAIQSVIVSPSPLFELASVLVRLDHVATFIEEQ